MKNKIIRIFSFLVSVAVIFWASAKWPVLDGGGRLEVSHFMAQAVVFVLLVVINKIVSNRTPV